MTKLVIDNVDTPLLEKQRLALMRVLGGGEPLKEDLETCEGLLNMLDEWSDGLCRELTIHAKEWFDRANGNSYFSARVYEEGELLLTLPFQHGYGDHSLYKSLEAIATGGVLEGLPTKHPEANVFTWFSLNHVNYEHKKDSDCLKRDVKAFGEKP